MRKIIYMAVSVILIVMSLVGCGYNSERSAFKETQTISEEVTTSVSTKAISQETTINYSSLSNEEFANCVAEDFSTNEVSFSVRSVSDNIAFLDATGSDNINVHIGFSDYGNNITMSFFTDGSEDECYYVLLQALKSDIFGISLDDQIDILAHYMVDEIDYKQGSLRITETINDNTRTIGFRL